MRCRASRTSGLDPVAKSKGCLREYPPPYRTVQPQETTALSVRAPCVLAPAGISYLSLVVAAVTEAKFVRAHRALHTLDSIRDSVIAAIAKKLQYFFCRQPSLSPAPTTASPVVSAPRPVSATTVVGEVWGLMPRPDVFWISAWVNGAQESAGSDSQKRGPCCIRVPSGPFLAKEKKTRRDIKI